MEEQPVEETQNYSDEDELNESGEEEEGSGELDLTAELLRNKMKIALLRKKRRILLEELHRQCLEGELDPKKRMKPYFDKRKKSKNSNSA